MFISKSNIDMDKSSEVASEILNRIAVIDTAWKAKAEYRQKNKDWLRRSAKIALQVLSKLEQNRKAGATPASQKDLAEVLGISPQQVNKIVKGNENLTLETISRLEKALSVQLIAVYTSTNAATYAPVALVAEGEVGYNRGSEAAIPADDSTLAPDINKNKTIK